MQALEVWKHVYSIFAPYIQFHRDCTKQSHHHLARAVIAHQLWMRCYVALKERYSKNSVAHESYLRRHHDASGSYTKNRKYLYAY
jgi:hypothetical protein